MTWFDALERWTVERMAEAPFAPKAVITPSSFAKQSLRRQLAAAMAARDLPLTGLSFVTPGRLETLYTLPERPRSSLEVRVRLIEAFGEAPDLLGGRGERPWRTQLRLAQALLRDDVEAIDEAVLNEALNDSPRLLDFVRCLRRSTSEMGVGAGDAIDAGWAAVDHVFALPMPQLPQRQAVAIDALDPVRARRDHRPEVLCLRARRPEQLAASIAAHLDPSARVAIVCMSSEIVGAMGRALDARGLAWLSPMRRGEGSVSALRALRQHPIAEQRERRSISDWAAEIESALGQDDILAEGLDSLRRFGDVGVPGAAFVDLLAEQCGRRLPVWGWRSGTIHLLGPGAWPDDAYDQVHIAGAQRGSLDRALGDSSPLLSFEDRQRLSAIDLLSFDLSRSGERRQNWLDAWSAASKTLVISWWERNASDMELVPDRWAKDLVSGRDALEPVVPEFTEAPLPGVPVTEANLSSNSWSPSRIEAFARCPRQALLGRLLKLETDDLDDGLELFSNPMWMGTVLHAIVEEATKSCHRQAPQMPQAMADVAADVLRREGVPERLVRAMERSMLQRLEPLAERFRQGQFPTIIAAEQWLRGENGLWAKCDLILRDAQGRKVLVDLKTGRPRDAATLAKSESHGESVQRGLYMKLCPDAAGAALLYLQPGPLAYQMVDDVDAETAKTAAEEAWERAKAIVEEGRFEGVDVERTCDTCEYRAACRPLDKGWLERLAERSETDHAQ